MYVRTLLMFVKDIEKSRNFYKFLLGQEPVEDLSDFVSFNLSGTYLNLHREDEKSPVNTGGSIGYLAASSLQNIIDKGLSLGATIWRGPLNTGNNITIVQLKDPYGNVIGFEGDFETIPYSLPI